MAQDVKAGFSDLNNKIETVSKKQKRYEESLNKEPEVPKNTSNRHQNEKPLDQVYIEYEDDQAYEYEEDYLPGSENEFIETEKEVLSRKVFEDSHSETEVQLKPKVMYNFDEVPKIYSEMASTSAPTSESGNFSIRVSDHLICILKGLKRHQSMAQRFDLVTRDSDYKDIFSHANSKFAATDIPDDCFKIAASARPALAVAYKALARNQMILKNNVLHAEMVQDKFKTEDSKEAQELIKIFISPIDGAIENIHDCIRRIRSIALPRFIPLALKKSLIAAPIIPYKIWNISQQSQSRILAARSEYMKKFNPRTSTPARENWLFQTRGRFFDRRGRPQRRGGPYRRRFTGAKTEKSNADKN